MIVIPRVEFRARVRLEYYVMVDVVKTHTFRTPDTLSLLLHHRLASFC
jgi:hypothetical protein